MSTQLCKNYEKCPIYNGVLSGKGATAGIYKRNYCEAGEAGWLQCKRFIVKEKTGKCPPDLLPNSTKSIEEIIKNIELT
jgi:hypothetical protein